MIKRFGDEPMQLFTNEQLVALDITQNSLLYIRLSPTGRYFAVANQPMDPAGSHLFVLELPALLPSGMTGDAITKPVVEWVLPNAVASLEWSPDESALAFLMMSDSGGTVEVLRLADAAPHYSQDTRNQGNVCQQVVVAYEFGELDALDGSTTVLYFATDALAANL